MNITRPASTPVPTDKPLLKPHYVWRRVSDNKYASGLNKWSDNVNNAIVTRLMPSFVQSYKDQTQDKIESHEVSRLSRVVTLKWS